MTRTFIHPPEGTRYYDLSRHASITEALQLAGELIAFNGLPCYLPDDSWLVRSR